MASLIQLVCGLGPHKGYHLLKVTYSRGLSDPGCLQPWTMQGLLKMQLLGILAAPEHSFVALYPAKR